MGIALRNKIDLQLSLEARQMWNEDALFKPFFHNTGRVSLHQVTFFVEVVVVKFNLWSTIDERGNSQTSSLGTKDEEMNYTRVQH